MGLRRFDKKVVLLQLSAAVRHSEKCNRLRFRSLTEKKHSRTTIAKKAWMI